MLAEDPWEWRAVWVSGLAALDSGDFAAAQSAFNAVYGQVPGELAPKLALALACERGGEGDDRRGALPDLRQHRRQLRGPGRVRPGPDPRRARRRRRGGRGAGPGAVDQPQLHRGPAAAGGRSSTSPGRVCRRWPRPWTACKGVSLDPRDQAELTAAILERARGRGRARTDPKTGVMIGPYAARDEALRDGLEAHLPHAGRHRDRRRPALRAGRQGQRRAKVDPAMTDHRRPAGPALRLPQLRRQRSRADAAPSARPAASRCTPTASRGRGRPSPTTPRSTEIWRRRSSSPVSDPPRSTRRGRGRRSRSPGPARTAAAWSGPTATARPAA